MGKRKLKDWEIEELKKWPKKSKRKFWYWIKYGSLAWGLPTGLIMSAYYYFTDSDNFSLTDSVIRIVVFMLFGLFYGMWLYSFNNKQYQKHLNKSNPPD